jgi:transcriptional regulator with XRE-family HTH domain
MKKFGDWLSEQLIQRDMKPADLTRLSGIESGVLSNLINNKRSQPRVETCMAIAKALNIPLEEVYRAAGILPPKPDIDVVTEAILALLLELKAEDKKDILEYARLRHKLATEKNNLASATKGNIRRTAPT